MALWILPNLDAVKGVLSNYNYYASELEKWFAWISNLCDSAYTLASIWNDSLIFLLNEIPHNLNNEF